MKKGIGIVLFLCFNFLFAQTALAPRVQKAKNSYDASLKKLFSSKGLNYPCKFLYLRMMKFDKILEVWGSDNGQYKLLKTYPIAQFAGKLGPKNKAGDLQTPEGFYYIGAMNPKSEFYLSLEIKYPNKADSIRSPYKGNYGGDIYIHGGELSAGCAPIGDDNISELFWLCYQYRLGNPGVRIPIHIFPFKMDDANMAYFKKENMTKENHWPLWNQIAPMYKFFQSHKLLGDFTIDKYGNYLLSLPWD